MNKITQIHYSIGKVIFMYLKNLDNANILVALGFDTEPLAIRQRQLTKQSNPLKNGKGVYILRLNHSGEVQTQRILFY